MDMVVSGSEDVGARAAPPRRRLGESVRQDRNPPK